ncbi:MAG: NB-ARC domain-containing protein [Chloroflexi bacterium]|nr:NB-ARC domain-containing protein [Chloroflexota bacterium]
MAVLDFGELLKRYRKFAGYTQKELAYRVGIGRNTLNAWENDRRKPGDREIVLRLAGELNLYPQDLEATNAFLQAAGYAPQRLVDEETYLPGVSDLALRGRLYNVPSLPGYYLPREADLAGLREKVLAEAGGTVIGAGRSRPVVLYGMGGVGKSVLASALAHDKTIRAAFPDGIYWLTVGQGPGQPDERAITHLLGRQVELANLLGREPAPFIDVQQGRTYLRILLAGLTCLLILDDVWTIEQLRALDVLPAGNRSRLLLTTRDAVLVRALGAVEHQLVVLTETESMILLARVVAGVGAEPLPLSSLPPEAREILHECGGLPLALTMIGSMVQRYGWQYALERLRLIDLRKIQQLYPDYPYPNLLKVIEVSVNALEQDEELTRLNPVERYLDLAVFPEDTPIPPAVLVIFWQPLELNLMNVTDLMNRWVERSLARLDERGNLRLHDLQWDYVRQRAGNIGL